MLLFFAHQHKAASVLLFVYRLFTILLLPYIMVNKDYRNLKLHRWVVRSGNINCQYSEKG